MPSTVPSKSTATARIAKVPYLNTVPFFRGVAWEERYEVVECAPRELGRQASAGQVATGLLPIVDFFRLEPAFERLGRFGIAARGRAHSVMLFSRRPIRQLDGAVVAVTEQTSTSAVLLRLLLEQRHHVIPAAYEPRDYDGEAGRGAGDALLLIGDEALRFQQVNTQYPFEIDLAFEWWLWQHQPLTFAVWAIRKDAAEKDKKQIEAGLARALAINQKEFAAIGKEQEASLGLPAHEIERYLDSFIYRLGSAEEEGIATFRKLANEHQLL
ncbi:MAG: menaquinone biosynthesis protein [Candidatus Omnitrophica bacterium]|nr:menaquinone biosynthesis protein [Candidatus Omnitrophota bacterium]